MANPVTPSCALGIVKQRLPDRTDDLIRDVAPNAGYERRAGGLSVGVVRGPRASMAAPERAICVAGPGRTLPVGPGPMGSGRDGEESPCGGYAFEFVFAAVVESDS